MTGQTAHLPASADKSNSQSREHTCVRSVTFDICLSTIRNVRLKGRAGPNCDGFNDLNNVNLYGELHNHHLLQTFNFFPWPRRTASQDRTM